MLMAYYIPYGWYIAIVLAVILVPASGIYPLPPFVIVILDIRLPIAAVKTALTVGVPAPKKLNVGVDV